MIVFNNIDDQLYEANNDRELIEKFMTSEKLNPIKETSPRQFVIWFFSNLIKTPLPVSGDVYTPSVRVMLKSNCLFLCDCIYTDKSVLEDEKVRELLDILCLDNQESKVDKGVHRLIFTEGGKSEFLRLLKNSYYTQVFTEHNKTLTYLKKVA